MSGNFENLMVSVSGVRGIVGEGLTPQIAVQFAQAYGSEFGPGTIVVGRDSRVSGPMIGYAVWSGLLSTGCHVIDLGIVPTPTVEMMTERPEYCGGIIITASHNPREWNALKLLAPDGLFLNAEQGDRVIRRIHDQNFTQVTWDRVGTVQQDDTAIHRHIDAILNLKVIDPDQIQKQKFKVAVDCVNGAGGTLIPELLNRLGVEAVYLNREPHGRFPRSPEPIPENLGDLSNAVREHKADFGLAVDPDVDRLALVSEEASPLGEEYTLGLVTRFVLSSAPGPVVVNASTSQMIDDIAAEFKQPVYRTPVGEIHVAQKARAVGASIAGEGNGGVMYPELHIGRDAPVGIALVLQHLTEQKQSMSACFQQLPQYTMVKDKLTLAFDTDTQALLHSLANAHKRDMIDRTDGYKFIFASSWVHVRASNTEPIIRVIAEAPSREEARSLVDEFKKEIDAMVES